jgi:predicted ester cyclase
MATEENKAIARRFFIEAMNGKNLDIIDGLFATNYQAHPPGAAAPLNRMFLAGFPDLHISFEDEIAEGDMVVLRMTVRGTHQGDFMGMPPTGKQVTWTGMSMSRVAGGKIVEQWGEQDLLGLLQQLGTTPAAAQGNS